jgi:ubiquinone/menaquinone biosynthesis C-methylase UbiE
MRTTAHENQGEIFLRGEGDGYYDRNMSALEREDRFYCEELLCQALSPFKGEVNRILEIGCSSGDKLQYLCKVFEADGRGIDPSSNAVAAGNGRLAGLGIEKITLGVSTADVLPFDKHEFDLVYFGFCLYLVDRESLFAAITEANRVLRPGGFLAILDFDPAQRYKRPYHHKEGIFSYKEQYSNMFTATGHYYLVSKHSLSHSSHHFAKASDERVSLCLLYKELEAYGLEPGPRNFEH